MVKKLESHIMYKSSSAHKKLKTALFHS